MWVSTQGQSTCSRWGNAGRPALNSAGSCSRAIPWEDREPAGLSRAIPGPNPLPYLRRNSNLDNSTWFFSREGAFLWGPKRAPVFGELVGKAWSLSLFSRKSALEALWGGVAGRPSAVLLSLLYRVCTPHHQCLGMPVPDRAGRIIRKNSRVQKFKNSCPLLKENLQTRKGETKNPERWVPDPRTCPSTVKGSEVQAGQVLRRKV